ncbi:hypothetical protein AX16_006406, partial [Volvariella volvacea WC 439]
MQLLPNLYTKSPETPGITTLARHATASNSSPEASNRLADVPLDIWERIPSDIVDPSTLISLTRLSLVKQPSELFDGRTSRITASLVKSWTTAQARKVSPSLSPSLLLAKPSVLYMELDGKRTKKCKPSRRLRGGNVLAESIPNHVEDSGSGNYYYLLRFPKSGSDADYALMEEGNIKYLKVFDGFGGDTMCTPAPPMISERFLLSGVSPNASAVGLGVAIVVDEIMRMRCSSGTCELGGCYSIIHDIALANIESPEWLCWPAVTGCPMPASQASTRVDHTPFTSLALTLTIDSDSDSQAPLKLVFSADNATGTTEDHVLMQIPSHFGTMSAVDADNGRLNGPRHAGLSNPAFIPASLPTTDDTNTIPASPSTLQQVASSPEEHVAGPILKVIDNDIYTTETGNNASTNTNTAPGSLSALQVVASPPTGPTNPGAVSSTSKPIGNAGVTETGILQGIAESTPLAGGPLKLACVIALELVDLAQTAQSNKEDIVDIAFDVGNYITAIGDRIKGQKLLPGVEKYMNDLVDNLTNIVTSLKSIQPKNALSEGYYANKNKEIIHFCKNEVKRLLKQAQFELILDLHVKRLPAMPSDIHVIPPAPIIFGREKESTHGVKALTTSSTASYLAIIGAGGIGKTTLSHAIIHHPQVQQHFEHKWYISCESCTTSELLLQKLVQSIGGIQKPEQDMLKVLTGLVSFKTRALLILDNFETCYPGTETSKIEKILDIFIAGYVSVVLTSRSSSCPKNAQWEEILLQELEPQDAKKMYLTSTKQVELTPEAEQLLEEVGYMPLAIVLLSGLAKRITDKDLLNRWHINHTKMLKQQGAKSADKTTSIDKCIEYSINMLDDEYKQLCQEMLYIIALLPNGWLDSSLVLQEWLENEDIIEVVDTLCNQSLLRNINKGQKYKLLVPIAEYTKRQPWTDIKWLYRLKVGYKKMISEYE